MKVLMVVDSYSWALHNRAVNLKRHIKDINFSIIHFKDCKDDFKNYDVVYLLNWPIYGHIKSFIRKNRRYRLITSVSSHIGRPNAKKMLNLFNIFDAISCSNMFLYKEFSSAKLRARIFYTPFGVNTDLFYEKERVKGIVGWVGNSSRKVKRFEDISKVCKKLKLKLIIADHNSGFSRNEMCDFYNRIETLICFSESEGTPNPVLEALSCNKTIISTPVGNVPELSKISKNVNIIYNVKDMEHSILNVSSKYDNKIFRRDWSWEEKHKSFYKFIRGL